MEGGEELPQNETLSTVFDEDGSYLVSNIESEHDFESQPNFGFSFVQFCNEFEKENKLESCRATVQQTSELTLDNMDLQEEDDSVIDNPEHELDADFRRNSHEFSTPSAPSLHLYLSSDSEGEVGSPRETTSTSTPMKSSRRVLNSEDEFLNVLRKTCCEKDCLKSFSVRDIRQCRESLIDKKEFEKRQFVMDTLRNQRDSVGGAMPTNFFIFGKSICLSGWRTAYNISDWRYRDCVKRVKSGKTSARRLRRPSKKLREKTQTAEAWMSNLFTKMGDFMPHKETIHLPHSWTKKYVYERMLREDTTCYSNWGMDIEPDAISYSHFTRIWKKSFPKFVIAKTSDFTKCSTCTQLKDQYELATTDIKRAEIIAIMERHDNQVVAERKAYHEARQRARREPAEITCIIIDGMDQAKTNVPHFVEKDKDNAHLAQLPVHFTGVLVHAATAEEKIPFIFHDVKHVPHDSNLTIHCLTEVLHEVKDNLGKTLFLQLDNCARENKNRFVLSYISMLVQQDVFKEAIIHFLPVGHTHEDVDQLFSCISTTLQHRNAFTLKDLERVASESYSPVVKVIPVKMVQDVKSSLLDHMAGQFKNHSRPLWFRFRKANGMTYMHYRLWGTDPWEPASDSEWPMGLSCLETFPDLQEHLAWVKTSLEKTDFEKLCQELPGSYNSRLPQDAREWWTDFLSTKIRPTYEEVPPTQEWRLQGLLQRVIHNDLEEEIASLQPLRDQVERQCPEVSIGRQGRGPRGITVVKDYASLEVGMLASVHLEEKHGRPFIGRVHKVYEEVIDLEWFKGSWTGVWKPWTIKRGKESVPYVSPIPKSSLILWDFTLTQGSKLKQATVRELKSKYSELDQQTAV